MISCSHWGMFPPQPHNASMNNFHSQMQIMQMANAANSINQYYQNQNQMAVGSGLNAGNYARS